MCETGFQAGSPRPATPGDTEGILGLISEVYDEYGLVLDAENEEPHLLRAGEYFRSVGGEFWVLEDGGGRILGTVAVYLSGETGEIKSLYVHTSLRRQGAGRSLVDLATSHARETGVERMILWSDTRFTQAHRLYKSCGFEQSGVRDLGDSNDSWEYGFEKTLSA